VTRKLDPRPDFELAQQIRASLLLAPPLLYRQGCFFLPQPGGDKIGRRRIDTHLQVFRAFGATLTEGAEGLEIRIDRPFHSTSIQLDEASVMATENAMMMAAVAVGTTTISNAACEPHVVQLARFLQQLGAGIEGIGTNRLVITGKEQLGGGKHTIAEDHIEVGSIIALAAATRSDLIINNITPDNYGMIGQAFSTLGVEFMTSGNRILIPGDQKLEVNMEADGQLPRLHEAPWPGFPPDLSSMAIVLATQVEGPVLFQAWMFESRLFWVDSLISMGARLLLCDPHRVLVIGRSQLYGRLLTSPDIRAGMALLIAGLLAEGETIIKNINQINRGYEDIATRLNALGAGIRLIEQ
jgi:UDP-N-acetylglucosamine 1-carboxyvinyltransferase